jgi:hypothetical protein
MPYHWNHVSDKTVIVSHRLEKRMKRDLADGALRMTIFPPYH